MLQSYNLFAARRNVFVYPIYHIYQPRPPARHSTRHCGSGIHTIFQHVYGPETYICGQEHKRLWNQGRIIDLIIHQAKK
jgi:hypothetical protein